jgi:ComF family protein
MLAGVYRRLLSLLAPPLCWGCRGPAPAGGPLCRVCGAGLRRLPGEAVEVAGVPCFAPVAYEGAARELVRALKFGGARSVARSMAAAIVACAPAGLLAQAALVPVPLGARRERRRGFNQAALLAAALERRCGCGVLACLERRGAGSQVGRGRAARALATEHAMRAAPSMAVPVRAVLVDDVVTTGATLAAAAAALREAGCEQVAAVAYARTPGR